MNNDTPFGLSSAIYTQDNNRVQRAIRDVTTGILYVNSGTTGAEIQFPFGGTRGTGNGHREAGLAGLDVFTEWKVVYTDYSGKLQKAQITVKKSSKLTRKYRCKGIIRPTASYLPCLSRSQRRERCREPII